MKYSVLAVGRIRPPFADDEAHYRRLLAPHARVELIEVRDDAALERRIPPRAHRVLLDADGRQHDSLAFARWLVSPENPRPFPTPIREGFHF